MFRNLFRRVPSQLLQDVLDEYIAQNTRITSHWTKKRYRITFGQLGRYLGHPLNLSDLSDANLVGFMRHLKKQGNVVPSINGKRNCICAFWRWCAKKNLVRLWPTIQPMVEPEHPPDAWSLSDLGKIFEACKSQTGTMDGVSASGWWYSIHLFWYSYGERRSATLAAKWSDYDGTYLMIPAGVRKGGQKSMLYELIPEVAEAIEAIRNPSRELIWPWTGSGRQFDRCYREKIIEVAGVQYIKWRSGPQKMRRSYASHLEAAGGDATKGLKHSRASLAIKSYIDPRIAKEVNQSVLLPKVEVPR